MKGPVRLCEVLVKGGVRLKEVFVREAVWDGKFPLKKGARQGRCLSKAVYPKEKCP